MKLTKKLKKVIMAHPDQETVTYDGQSVDATQFWAELGLKKKPTNKYTVEKEHADLETEDDSGDIEDSGDGTSED